MAKTSQIVRNHHPTKFSSRKYTRCERYGRPHPVYRKLKLCYICLKDLTHRGQIPGIKKTNW